MTNKTSSLDGIYTSKEIVEVRLPYPPSANAIWRNFGGRTIKSAEYRAWIKEAGWAVKAQRPGQVSGPFKISLNAVRPDNRRRDLSNLLKATEDLLQAVGIIEDDCLAEMIIMRWVTTGDGICVRIEPAGVE